MIDEYPHAKSDHIGQRLTLMMLLDALFSCMVLFWWGRMSLLLGDPIRWATWSSIAPQPGLLDFPFVMVWGLPLLGVGLAWLLKAGGSLRPAVWVATFPLLYLGTLVGCFYVIPSVII